jgi:hypothetical protein
VEGEFSEVDLPLYGVLRRSPGGLHQEGQVTGTEVGDEEGYLEVTSDDGSQADVHLDCDFNVLTTLTDDESPDGKDKPNND